MCYKELNDIARMSNLALMSLKKISNLEAIIGYTKKDQRCPTIRVDKPGTVELFEYMYIPNETLISLAEEELKLQNKKLDGYKEMINKIQLTLIK